MRSLRARLRARAGQSGARRRGPAQGLPGRRGTARCLWRESARAAAAAPARAHRLGRILRASRRTGRTPGATPPARACSEPRERLPRARRARPSRLPRSRCCEGRSGCGGSRPAARVWRLRSPLWCRSRACPTGASRRSRGRARRRPGPGGRLRTSLSPRAPPRARSGAHQSAGTRPCRPSRRRRRLDACRSRGCTARWTPCRCPRLSPRPSHRRSGRSPPSRSARCRERACARADARCRPRCRARPRSPRRSRSRAPPSARRAGAR